MSATHRPRSLLAVSSPVLTFAPSSPAGDIYSLRTTRYSLLLQSYFRSGWAFFIPYLVAYLIYAWLKWPVNLVDSGRWTMVPCLLHVYWALHAIHFALGVIALRSWWKESVLKLQLSTSTGAPRTRSSATVLWSLTPWACLGLIYWVPGIYLEWPSDPWEHLRRINEWHILDQVTTHSSWKKSSYFLPFSLTGHTTGLDQLSWLNVYYTATCLLLSWQYYRLARAVGLGERASFIFVLLNALTFGNNIFSFYRYYGLSSSIIAQIGATAITRLALEALRPRGGEVGDSESNTGSPWLGGGWPLVRSLVVYGVAVSALIALTAFNHVQGVGIGGLGVMAVIIWRLIKWKRSMILWLACTAVVLSIVAVRWFPRHPLLDSELCSQGWITTWYGFDFFTPGSAAYGNMVEVVSVFGVVNIAAGLLLIRQNHVVGWLTVVPFLALLSPIFVIPFANAIAEGIGVYNRMLLAVPSVLALVAGGRCLLFNVGADSKIMSAAKSLVSIAWMRFGTLCILVSVAVATPSSEWGPNRAFHFLSTTPQDLQMLGLLAAPDPRSYCEPSKPSRLVTPAPTASIINTIYPDKISRSERRDCIATPVVPSVQSAIAVLASNRPLHAQEIPSLNRDPAMRHRESWSFLESDAAEFVSADMLNSERTVLQNPVGRRCTVFTAELIPVDPACAYFVEFTIRQTSDTMAVAHLAIAWYDSEGRFLESQLASPRGAGSPAGWGNGTFSYFGLIQNVVPTDWTTFRTSMGPNEIASIPPKASFLRLGAILNSSSVTNARIQMTGAHIWPKTPGARIASGIFPNNERVYVLRVSPMLLISPLSYSAYLSRHWPANQVASDLSGSAELFELAHAVTHGQAPEFVHISTPEQSY